MCSSAVCLRVVEHDSKFQSRRDSSNSMRSNNRFVARKDSVDPSFDIINCSLDDEDLIVLRYSIC